MEKAMTHTTVPVFETGLSVVSYMFFLVSPYLFFAQWVCMILIGRRLIEGGSMKLKKISVALMINAPISVLSAVAFQEYFHCENHIAALVGCIVALYADQVLDVKSNFSKRIINLIFKKSGEERDAQ